MNTADLYVARKVASKLSTAMKFLGESRHAGVHLTPEALKDLGAPNLAAALADILDRVSELRSLMAAAGAEPVASSVAADAPSARRSA